MTQNEHAKKMLSKLSRKTSLQDSFLLEADDLEQIHKKKGEGNKLIFAFLLKFFQNNGRFPGKNEPLLEVPMQQLATQLGYDAVDVKIFAHVQTDFSSRTFKRFRRDIRQHFGFREPSSVDWKSLTHWLCQFVFPQGPTEEQLLEKDRTFLS